MTDLVQRAYNFAKQAHEGQKRLDGRPYFVHPELVWKIVKFWNHLETIQAVALLHDIAEDTTMSIYDIRQGFGDDVAEAVQDLTNAQDHYTQYLLLLLEYGIDAAKIVKRADILANYYDCLKFPPPNKRTSKHLKNKCEMAYFILFGERIWEDKTLKKLLAGEIL